MNKTRIKRYIYPLRYYIVDAVIPYKPTLLRTPPFRKLAYAKLFIQYTPFFNSRPWRYFLMLGSDVRMYCKCSVKLSPQVGGIDMHHITFSTGEKFKITRGNKHEKTQNLTLDHEFRMTMLPSLECLREVFPAKDINTAKVDSQRARIIRQMKPGLKVAGILKVEVEHVIVPLYYGADGKRYGGTRGKEFISGEVIYLETIYIKSLWEIVKFADCLVLYNLRKELFSKYHKELSVTIKQISSIILIKTKQYEKR